MIRALVGCEFSGIVRRALRDAGVDAWSCDFQPAEDGSEFHIVGDVRDLLDKGWDLGIFHPPCTRLACSGYHWLNNPSAVPPDNCTAEEEIQWPALTKQARKDIMWRLLQEGCDLFSDCLNAPIPFVAVENPVMHGAAKCRINGYFKPAPAVHPWHFGTSPQGPDNVKKRICLWLRGLPPLTRTGTLSGLTARDDIMAYGPSDLRKMLRSRLFPGIAQAMADQWIQHIKRQQNETH